MLQVQARTQSAPTGDRSRSSAFADADAGLGTALVALVPSVGGLRPVLAWHLARPGGLTRGRLAVGVGSALGLAPELAVSLAVVAQAVHEASLLLDDINDRSPRRRDRAAAWVKFGADLAMLAGVRLLNSAHRSVAELASAGRVPIATAACVGALVEDALDGQATELAVVSGSWADYDWVVARKTGALMALPLLLPAHAAGLDGPTVQRLTALAERVGIAYQIADDIADEAFAGTAWADTVPRPQQRLTELVGSVRRDLERAGDPVSAALMGFVERLFP